MTASLESLQRWLGVTRVAGLTGLDRTGVEVAAAIRPRGHVLQVTNGKGASFAQAQAGALSEAAELWAAEHVDPGQLSWGTERELQRGEGKTHVWGFSKLLAIAYPETEALPRDAWPELRLGWRACVELHSGETRWLPAQAFHCLPEGGWSLGPQLLRWTTNGMGAHPRRDAALTHALLEAVERDQLARALPQGWTERAVQRRRLALDARTPQALRWERALERRGFQLFWFDLTPAQGRIALPTVGVLLVDRELGTERARVPLTAGYACALWPEGALLGALFEAAQSRLTEIQGAREDVVTDGASSVRSPDGVSSSDAVLAGWCRRSPARRSLDDLPPGSERRGGVLAALRAAGHSQVAMAELAPAGAPLSVVKVVTPTLRTSALL